ncbi:MAG TPA: hypothetical protein VNA57_08965 [Acidimicrobiales bacterium]|nr:hypothetical protein [Acidimicrobiales bacterium]
MIVRTVNATYELEEGEGRFRRVADSKRSHGGRKGNWRHFEAMGPVVEQQPLRFFWRLGSPSDSRATRLGIWSTTPVVEVLR